MGLLQTKSASQSSFIAYFTGILHHASPSEKFKLISFIQKNINYNRKLLFDFEKKGTIVSWVAYSNNKLMEEGKHAAIGACGKGINRDGEWCKIRLFV